MSAQLPEFPSYTTLRALGSGGFADVFEAFDPRLRRRVAIKRLRETSDQQVERFVRECEALARIRHPHVIVVHEVVVDERHPYAVFELLSGQTLDDRISAGLDPVEGARLLLEGARGVEVLHGAGLVHRDIKPENLLIDDEGRVKVADLGLVAGGGLDTLTSPGAVLGTPAYFPPEFCTGQGLREPTSDVYMLGASLYHVLTGEYPHTGNNLTDLLMRRLEDPNPDPWTRVPSLPAELVRVCRIAMDGNPALRYPDAGAFADALEEALAERAEEPPGMLLPLVAAAAILLIAILAVRSAQAPALALPSASPTKRAPAPTPDTSREDVVASFEAGRVSLEAARAWIAAHPEEEATIARLRRVARLRVLAGAPQRAYRSTLEHAAHVPFGIPTGPETLLWVELCTPGCQVDHARGRLLEFQGKAARLRPWAAGAITAIAADTSLLASYDGREGTLWAREGSELSLLGRFPKLKVRAILRHGPLVILGAQDGRLLGFDPESRSRRFEVAAHGGIVSDLVEGGEWVFSLACDGSRPIATWEANAQALRARETPYPAASELGALRWGRASSFGPIVCQDRVHVVTGLFEEGPVAYVGEARFAREVAPYQKQWSPDRVTPQGAEVCFDLLVVVGGRLNGSTRYGQLRVFEVETGQELAAREAKGQSLLTCTLDAELRLCVGLCEGERTGWVEVYALDPLG